MKNITFLPWVGKSYSKGIDNKKVMVLGESHYCALVADAKPELSSEVIQDLFDEKSEHEAYKNTYTKFERALAGKILSFKEKRDLWNMFLFYNYVQTPMTGARVAPTEEEFNLSESALFGVLEKYKPDYMIVWGARLYNNLPKKGFQLTDLNVKNVDSFETWGYELSNGHIVQLLCITHPSAAFEPPYWHQIIHAFIKREL